MRKIVAFAFAAVFAFALTGFAVARHERQQPRTDQALAVLTGERRVSVQQTVCQGQDGEYREAREVFVGTSESPDPRLDGRLKVRVHSLINRSPDQQEGIVKGRIVIREEDSRRIKASGRFFAVSDDAATLEGVFVGRVHPQRGGGDRGRQRLFANFFGSFNAMDDEQDFRVTLGQEPPTDSARNSAVIQIGTCGGPRGPKHD